MKFIQRGAVRIESIGGTRSFANVAFRNPDGTPVLVVVNAEGRERSCVLVSGGRAAPVRLPAKAAATFVWRQ